jgi:Flp pilus assembly protein TadG
MPRHTRLLVSLRPVTWRRRATVAALVGVTLPVLMGFMALSIDVGAMYNAKAELQRAADAAAMAAAYELGDNSGDPLARAQAKAGEFARKNTVFGHPTTLAGSDFTFGQAYISDANKYVFIPTTTFPNAVRVHVRRTKDSPSGAFPLFFARIFGVNEADISATATAALTPRDICFVMDVSGSHNDDSSLRAYKKTNVPIKDVWSYLWDTSLGSPPAGCGPSFGNLKAWGADTVDPSWDFPTDAGLVNIPQGTSSVSKTGNLTSAFVNQTITAKGYTAYTSSQVTTINTGPRNESATSYKRRVRVALGLDRWRPSSGTDTTIDASEISAMIPYPSTTANAATTKSKVVGGTWDSYVDYVISTSSSMNKYDPAQFYYGDPGLRYRYGLKTFVDYLQETQYGDSVSPGLRGSPEQPMRSVTDAVVAALDIIEAQHSNDLVGLAAYDTYGYGPAEKPNNLSWLVSDLQAVRAKVSTLHAAMWLSYTNTAQGMDKGCEVLFNSPDERRAAAKVIILLTDGQPNQTRANPPTYYAEFGYDYDHSPAKQDAVAAAADAANGVMDTRYHRKAQVYTVSVGATCDPDLMSKIAGAGKGETFHAAGAIATYQQQLQDILKKLGGKRPVVLIE